MSSPTYKVGFVGLSTRGWASSILAPPLIQNPSYQLVAVSTTSAESAEASAKKYSTPERAVNAYHGSTTQIANDPDVNLVAVSVKAPHHKDTATPVLDAGKDIFIEWPAGRTTSETKEFARVAKEKGVRSIVGLQTRHSVFLKTVKEIIASGKIGTVKSTSFTQVMESLWAGEVSEYNLYTFDKTNGATLIDIALGHFLDALQYLLGDFRSVSATAATLWPEGTITETGQKVKNTGEDHVALSGILGSGVFASISARASNGSIAGERLVWEIQGSIGLIRIVDDPEGSAYVNLNDPKIFLNGELVKSEGGGLATSTAWMEFARGKGGGGLATSIANAWTEFAKGREGVYPTLDDAVKLHELLDAIRKSAKEGVRVDL